MLRTLRAGTAGATITTLLCLAGCGGDDDRSPVERSTTYGTIVGTDDAAASGTYHWKGVPFARPLTVA